MTSREDKMHLDEVPSPALLVDSGALERDLATMAAALPGERLRPHVKAHKCTSLAKRQAVVGHEGFTCATIRECEGMNAAGLGDDLLLANEVVDATRLGTLIAGGARVTVAVDSPETIEAARTGGVREVLIDVNVELRRCGCQPRDAGRFADLARRQGLAVRGVMGYEGHVVGVQDASERAAQCQQAMELLLAAHQDVGGDLMAFGMDHGKPELADATVLSCSDEHATFAPPRSIGERVRLVPAHVDPTIAYRERAYIFSGDEVLGVWPIDLRGW
jgi:D-threonine aldolase